MAVKMIGGKCGCTYCKGGLTGSTSREFWYSKRNKYGRTFGAGQGYMRGKRSKKAKGG